MKIAKVVIENFRHIEKLELDFTDSLGRVRDLILLVGPNACGKTSILDALALAIGPITENVLTRPGLTLTPGGTVRHTAPFAQVSCQIYFSDEEIMAARQAWALFQIGESNVGWRVLGTNEAKVVWRYPDPEGKLAAGRTEYTPDEFHPAFYGR